MKMKYNKSENYWIGETDIYPGDYCLQAILNNGEHWNWGCASQTDLIWHTKEDLIELRNLINEVIDDGV